MISLRVFRQDPYMLLRYHIISLGVMVLIDALLIFCGRGSLKFTFSLWYLMLVPPAIAFGSISAALIHNATHGSIRPRWLNGVVGEIFGTHQLYGFAGWAIQHYIHHLYPDDSQKDPHAPGMLPFWSFTWRMQKQTHACIRREYYENHGQSEKTRRIWAVRHLIWILVYFSKVLFWFLLLGPNVFVWFYIPSLISNILFFAHFNYYTHREREDGTVDILNLDHNLYYKMVNFIAFGIYFHKLHHTNPALFNPKGAVTSKSPTL